jgi:hypothetical protein
MILIIDRRKAPRTKMHRALNHPINDRRTPIRGEQHATFHT